MFGLKKKPVVINYKTLHAHVLIMIDHLEKQAMTSPGAARLYASELLDLYKLEKKYSKMRTYHD